MRSSWMMDEGKRGMVAGSADESEIVSANAHAESIQSSLDSDSLGSSGAGGRLESPSAAVCRSRGP